MMKRLLLALMMVFLASPARAEPSFVVRHGDREQPRIAITVDDCYDIQHIEAVLDLCVEYNAVVTFFPIGNALKYADAPVWQRAVALGCEIGNHTWGHKRMTGLNEQEIRFAMLRIQQKVDALLECHYPMQVMRPPMGTYAARITPILQDLGYFHAVKWDVSQTDPDKALRLVENGSILLYHGRKKDVDCLRELIPALLEEGYELVTVSELLGLEPVETEPEMYIYKKGD